ncbi:hypothetical protein [Thermogutta sp.]|uniref:hypothetical protein n=1 Tax=Thermogutta sp. TaxID=1962930 RepID=UPI003C7DD0A1
MYGAPLILLLCCGVDVGWQPSGDGGIEYIIQISPEELQNLRPGDILAASDVPPNLPPITTYRVVVGSGPLPRKLPEAAFSNSQELPSAAHAGRPPSASPGLRATPPGSPPGPIATAQSAVALIPTENESPNSGNRQVDESSHPSSGPAKSQAIDGSGPSPPDEPGEQSTQSISPQENGADTAASQRARATFSAPIDARWPFLLVAATAITTAGMCFASWIAWDYRKKYLSLLQQCHPEQADVPGELASTSKLPENLKSHPSAQTE